MTPTAIRPYTHAGSFFPSSLTVSSKVVLLWTTAKSRKQTPKGVMLSQFAGTHAPAFRTLLPVQDMHLPLPLAKHEPHETSHFEHVPPSLSRYSSKAQVRTQVWSDVKTGLDDLQEVHLSGLSEQVAQSGWHAVHGAELFAWKKPAGQLSAAMQVPSTTR